MTNHFNSNKLMGNEFLHKKGDLKKTLKERATIPTSRHLVKHPKGSMKRINSM